VFFVAAALIKKIDKKYIFGGIKNEKRFKSCLSHFTHHRTADDCYGMQRYRRQQGCPDRYRSDR